MAAFRGNRISVYSTRRSHGDIVVTSLIGHASPGMHQIIFKSIMKCDLDVRSDMYKNIVLSGGSTMFPGKFVHGHSRTVNRSKIPDTNKQFKALKIG